MPPEPATEEEPSLRIDRATVRRQVEDQLRRAIVSGRFAPGAHLSDRVLCDMLKVSRPVVREAVRQIEAEGLLRTEPHRGTFVKVLSADEAAQIYDVRCVLEALAAQLFARHASEQEVRALRAALEAIATHQDAPAGATMLDLKQRFYEVLLRGSRNEHVRRMLSQFLNANMQLRATSMSSPERLRHTVRELQALVDAIERRDEAAAWQASCDHVRAAAAVALGILREREREQAAGSGTALGDGSQPIQPERET